MHTNFVQKIYILWQNRGVRFYITFALVISLLLPQIASANVFGLFSQANAETNDSNYSINENSQNIQIVESNSGPSSTTTLLSSDNLINSESALNPSVGPLGSSLDISQIPVDGGQINVYTVRSGDTIASIAQMFGVSKETIIEANDLKPKQSLKIGTVLAILPVSGHIHIIKNGETLESIAKKYNVDVLDIAEYNDLESGQNLEPGTSIIIPDQKFEISQNPDTTSNQSSKVNSNDNINKKISAYDPDSVPITAHPMRINIKTDLGNALLRPVSIKLSHETQGAHGIFGSAVDLGAPIGTPIVASADGVVALAKDTGWNGGYGEYVIIMSNINGNIVQTIYAHMSKVLTANGANVSRGEIIGLVGQTGNATGPHVHFEVHGALNPLTINPDYTGE